MATKHLRAAAAVAALAAGAIALVGCSGGSPAPGGSDAATSTTDMDALVAAAKAEGGVTFYGDASEPTVQAWTDDFTKQYGIPVTIVRNTPGPLYQQFSQEMAAGSPQADIIAIVDHTSLDDAVDNQWIAQYTPQAAADYDKTYVRDGYYYPSMNAVEQAIAYNPDNLTSAQIDLIHTEGLKALEDPSFAGEVGIVQPQISSGVQSFWYLYTDGDASADFGWDGMAAVAKNTSIISDTLTLGQDVIQGEIAVAAPIVDSFASSQISNGAPLQFVYATPTIGQADGVAVVAGSQHPNAARLFAEWAASPEANTLYSKISQSAPLSAKATDSRGFLDADWYQPVGDDTWTTYASDQDFLSTMAADGPYFPKWNATTGYSG